MNRWFGFSQVIEPLLVLRIAHLEASLVLGVTGWLLILLSFFVASDSNRQQHKDLPVLVSKPQS